MLVVAVDDDNDDEDADSDPRIFFASGVHWSRKVDFYGAVVAISGTPNLLRFLYVDECQL